VGPELGIKVDIGGFEGTSVRIRRRGKDPYGRMKREKSIDLTDCFLHKFSANSLVLKLTFLRLLQP